METDRWKKHLAIAVIAALVMIAGAVIGAGVTVMYFGRMFLPRPDSPDQAARLITERLGSEVELSRDERLRTQELVQRRMDEIAAIRKRYEDEVTSKLGTMSEGITEIIGRERSAMCGGWMRRYRPGEPGDGGKEKAACRCEGKGSGCGR